MLKLGSATGSIVNHLHSRGVIGEPTPEVGMGATLLAWTDRYAATIHAVKELTSKLWSLEIEVSRDDAKVVAGSCLDGSAEYEFTSRPGATRTTYRKDRKTGFWHEVALNLETGKYRKTGGNGIRIGAREEYRDPSF